MVLYQKLKSSVLEKYTIWSWKQCAFRIKLVVIDVIESKTQSIEDNEYNIGLCFDL